MCDVEEFGRLESSEKTIAILGDRRLPQTAKQDGDRISKQLLCSIWKKRNERPIAGGVSIRSRNGAPSRNGCVVNGQLNKASNKRLRPPPCLPTYPLSIPTRVPTCPFYPSYPCALPTHQYRPTRAATRLPTYNTHQPTYLPCLPYLTVFPSYPLVSAYATRLPSYPRAYLLSIYAPYLPCCPLEPTYPPTRTHLPTCLSRQPACLPAAYPPTRVPTLPTYLPCLPTRLPTCLSSADGSATTTSTPTWQTFWCPSTPTRRSQASTKSPCLSRSLRRTLWRTFRRNLWGAG